MNPEVKIARDVFIEEVCKRMQEDKNIFFLCADFGSPKLDILKQDFKERFINVGIAEQNLINISTGLALEGFTVYAYAIASFLTMRAYEQIRVNLSLHSQLKEININLIGVGAGLSYDVSGPSHHCLEDISIMRTLPNIMIFSPSDSVLIRQFVDYSIKVKKPKYLRLDGKPLYKIYNDGENIKIENGFAEIKKGEKICLVSTGYMTQVALRVAEMLSKENIGIIDIFMLRPFNENLLFKALKKYRFIITLEEGFINRAGLDSLISCLLNRKKMRIEFKSMGFDDSYIFNAGNRNYLHMLCNLDEKSIIKNIREFLKRK